jgi:pyrophosphatase PpaX
MKAVIFDLDGTLLDVLECFFWQFEALTEEYDGKKVLRSDIVAAGHGTTEEIVRSLVKNTDVPFDTIVERHDQLRLESYDKHLRLYPGVTDLLLILQRTGVKIGALTSGNQRTVEAMERTGIAPYFQTVITATDVTSPKPNPEGMYLALNRMGVQPHEAMMVGDSVVDVLVGKNAGLAKTVAVSYGFGRLEDLHAAEPDHVIHDVPTLLDVVWSR